MQNFDVELALMTLSSMNANEVLRLIPQDYLVENKSDTGWGYVITPSDNKEFSGDLDQHITDFVAGLAPVLKWIKDSSSVLRVAVYNDKMTCTVNLNKFDFFVSSDIKLELTVYPVD